MAPDVTIFAASYLVYISAALAVVAAAILLRNVPRLTILRWIVSVIIMLVVAFALARVASAVYNDPRPFTQDHVKPLIAHAADNGFPSDHALLGAAIVAAILLLSPWWSIPFILAGVAVDWARVGAGIHHVSDVVGSSVIVAIAILVALLASPPLVRWLVPHLPASWIQDKSRSSPAA